MKARGMHVKDRGVFKCNDNRRQKKTTIDARPSCGYLRARRAAYNARLVTKSLIARRDG
jgi:hypothetical protein